MRGDSMPGRDDSAAMTGTRSVLVSGWVGAANIGDELIFASLAEKLRASGVSTLVMSTNPDETRLVHGRDGIDAVGWYDVPGVLRAMARSDGVILGPGGLLQDETSIWNLPAHLHRVYAAKMARKPLLGIGLGVGPLDSALSRRLVRAALRRTPITVRDEASATLAVACGLEDVTVTADLAYGLAIPQGEPLDRIPIDRIVASLRPFTGGGGVTPARRSDLRSLTPNDRVLSVAGALDELSRRTSLPIHLLAFEAERDVRYHHLIADAMATEVTTATATVDTVFEEVAASRLVVAMRYHAVVTAIMALRPAVVITYSPKVRDAALLLGPAGILLENDAGSYRGIAEGAALLDRDHTHTLTAVRDERRSAEHGNDEALGSFLARL